MATDVMLYQVIADDPTNSSPAVGHFSLREIEWRGLYIGSMKCLSIDVEAHGPQQPLYATDDMGNGHQVMVSWLQLEVVISTLTTPRREIGRVHIDGNGMLPLGPGNARHGTWMWEIRSEDVETLDQARSNQASDPIYFDVDISGIGKLVGDNNKFYDVVAVRGGGQQLKEELSHWGRLLAALGYAVPPTQSLLIGRGMQEHRSWADAARRLDSARQHLRNGEDYGALRESLSSVEALVSLPYQPSSWKPLLATLPDQKVDGLAELFSGFATFCNKIGHHRERSNRDGAGDLATMPVDHWEVEIAVALAQYILTYASRLRMSGILAEKPPGPAGQAGVAT